MEFLPNTISEIIKQYTYEHHIDECGEFITLHDLREGVSIYYENGMVTRVICYHRGYRDGLVRYYDSEGRISYEGYNRNDQFHGMDILYDYNSIIANIGIFHNGDGYEYTYTSNGTLEEVRRTKPIKLGNAWS